MKRILLMLLLFCLTIGLMAQQRYDYDDIYFNPKTDLNVSEGEYEKVGDEVTTAVVVSSSEGEGSLSYTDRINLFHRSESDDENDLSRIDDPDYTNIFVLSDGQYVVNVDGSDVSISENYNYPMYDMSYSWNRYGYSSYPYSYYRPYFYGSYGYYDPWYSVYDPWYNAYDPWFGVYDPWYDPYFGYAGYYPYYPGYHHVCHHHYYPWYDYPTFSKVEVGGNENERRRVHNSTGITNSLTSDRSSVSSNVRRAPSSRDNTSSNRRTVSSNTTSTRRGASTSVSRGTSSTRRTSVALPARPVTTRSTRVNTSVSRPSSVTTRSTTTRRSSSTVRSSSPVRSSSSSVRSSSGSYSTGGHRSGGSVSTSTRRR